MSNRPHRPRSAVAAGRPGGAPPSRRVPTLLLALFAVAALLALVAFVAGGASEDDGPVGADVEETRPVAVHGDTLPPFDEGGDEAVGLLAPTVSGRSFDGTPVSLGRSGQPRVIAFVAHWCSHCQAEVPRLVAWLEANGYPDDVDIYAVATGTSSTQPNYPPSAWLESEGWTVPTMADSDSSDAGAAYGVASYPAFVAVAADGTVAYRTSGELDEAQWEDLLDRARP